MKYKVGDIVRLKSAEELIDLGLTYDFAEHYAGKEFPIINMTKDKVRLEISEDWLDIKIIEGMDDRYTFDELKKRVNDLKDYATKLSSELNVGLSIEVETEVELEEWGKKAKGFSRINIMD